MAFYDIEGDEYLLGAGYDVLGEDEDYLLGAALRRMPARRRARVAKAMATRKAMTGTVVKASPPTKAQELILGFDSTTTIAAAASSQITSRPQEVFRGERLIIPSTIAPQFLITDLKIGKNSQFLNSNNVPGEAFAANTVGVRMRMDTAQVNSDIVISVTNVSAGALRFTAALVGTTIT